MKVDEIDGAEVLGAEEEIAQKPVGRDAILNKWKANNPEAEGDPSEDDLWGLATEGYDDLKGRHKGMSDANGRLAELVAKDPKLGAVLSMIAGEDPKSFPYAVSSVYGKEPFDLEGDSLEEFEKGYQENIQSLAESQSEREQAQKNIEEYKTTLSKYGTDNELSEDEVGEINEGVMLFADNLLMGNVPSELIEMIHKGMSYDKDVQEAADTGFVEGKGQNVKAEMKKKTSNSAIPDLGSGTGAGKNKPIPRRKKGSAYDGMEEVKI